MARGFKLTDLPDHLRDAVRKQLDDEAKAKKKAQDRANRAQEWLAGRLEFWIPGEPPTATHHAKSIKKFGNRLTLGDDPALVAARAWYAAAIPINPDKAKMLAPVEAQVQFRWTRDALSWYVEKPDADNASKAVLDTIEKHGWLRDKGVACLLVQKLRVADIADAGVAIRLRTLTTMPAIWKPRRMNAIEPL